MSKHVPTRGEEVAPCSRTALQIWGLLRQVLTPWSTTSLSPEGFRSTLGCEGNDTECLQITASLQPFEFKNNGKSVA